VGVFKIVAQAKEESANFIAEKWRKRVIAEVICKAQLIRSLSGSDPMIILVNDSHFVREPCASGQVMKYASFVNQGGKSALNIF
jgi:hypothetical protein